MTQKKINSCVPVNISSRNKPSHQHPQSGNFQRVQVLVVIFYTMILLHRGDLIKMINETDIG